MKQKIKLLLLIAAFVFAGCGSNRVKDNDPDSLMRDTSVIDTVDMQAAPVDTTVMRVDTVSQDPD